MAYNGRIIKTRQDLRDYILRQLGFPVVNVELDSTQLEDCINDAIYEFIPYAYSASEQRYFILEVAPGDNSFEFDFPVLAVTNAKAQNSIESPSASGDLFTMNQFVAIDIMRGGMGKIDLLTYELTMQMVETMKFYFDSVLAFDYNTISNTIHLFNKFDYPTKIMIEYYRPIDITEDIDEGKFTGIYDVKWIKAYATALSRRQWAYNIMKYEGSTLPQGLALNSSGLLGEAKEAIEKLMEQLHTEYELPIDFQIG